MGFEHNHSHHISGKKLFWTVIFNAIITAAEFIGGFFTGYLALIADAVHNLSDVAALGLAWLGVKGSELPPTKKSTYGYKRIEVLTAFISATTLVVIAVFIFMEAYDRFINPQPIVHPWLFIIIAVIGLVGNVVSILLLHSEKGKSLNMKTAFLHMAYDAVSSVAVIIGGILIFSYEIYIIDVILSVIIAMMILWSSYTVLKEAILIFLEAVPDNIEFDKVLEAINHVNRVKSVHHLHIWSLSSKDIALSCHIVLDEADYINLSPVVIKDVNKMLCDKFDIGHATIQLENDGDCRYEGSCRN